MRVGGNSMRMSPGRIVVQRYDDGVSLELELLDAEGNVKAGAELTLTPEAAKKVATELNYHADLAALVAASKSGSRSATTNTEAEITCQHSWHYGDDGLPTCKGDACTGQTVACGRGLVDCERHAPQRTNPYLNGQAE